MASSPFHIVLRSTILQPFNCQGTRFSLFFLSVNLRDIPPPFSPTLQRTLRKQKDTLHQAHDRLLPKRLLMRLDRMRLFIGCVNLYSVGLALTGSAVNTGDSDSFFQRDSVSMLSEYVRHYPYSITFWTSLGTSSELLSIFILRVTYLGLSVKNKRHNFIPIHIL